MKKWENSNTWPSVRKFAVAMEAKLALNRHKGDRRGWLKDEIGALLRRLDEEVEELNKAVDDDEPYQIVLAEAADVANFAMMIADWMDENN